jgi:hypothetical protein
METYFLASFTVLSFRPDKSRHESLLLVFLLLMRPPAARSWEPKPPLPPSKDGMSLNETKVSSSLQSCDSVVSTVASGRDVGVNLKPAICCRRGSRVVNSSKTSAIVASWATWRWKLPKGANADTRTETVMVKVMCSTCYPGSLLK